MSLRLEAAGRAALEAPTEPLDCGNSGTTIRLLTGVLASTAFSSVLTGDESLASRPMERVAAPLREMGADVATTDGHPPVRIGGSPLRGIRHAPPVPSAQVKGAILFAALDAEGETTVVETAPTRDHTERALEHLGAPVHREGAAVSLRRFQHEGFAGSVPGDVSSAAFLVAAAAVTGGELRIERVGLNPSRTHFLEVLARMGVRTHVEVEGEELGEPVGTLSVDPVSTLRGTTVTERELPLVIDEVPILAMLAAHARGDTWFVDAGELRVKESDRLNGLSRAIRTLGGHAGVERDDLVIAGGGLTGGLASSGGDHRMAMAVFVGGLAASGPVTIEGMEAADVSFPGFPRLLRELGASVELA